MPRLQRLNIGECCHFQGFIAAVAAVGLPVCMYFQFAGFRAGRNTRLVLFKIDANLQSTGHRYFGDFFMRTVAFIPINPCDHGKRSFEPEL